MSLNTKLIIAAASVVFLNGCAVSKMLMAGYIPPQTIADLLRAQEAEEIALNDDMLSRDRSGISLENYKDDTTATELSMDDRATENLGDADYMQPWQAPSTSFRPSFSHKSLQDYAGQLSMQLLRNSAGMNKNDLIGVASFVRLDRSLQQTNILGNQLAEYFISEIQQFGLAVVDFKMASGLKVTQRGDFVFSRDSLELAQDMKMDHMLSGTMIDKQKGVQINARIISVKNNRVVASASVLIPHFIAQSLRPDYVTRLSTSD
ncbi:MAG: TolB-like protein [Glaciecola sp.]|jgi:TolB-like protein